MDTDILPARLPGFVMLLLAHTQPLVPQMLWSVWTFEPLVVGLLVMSLGLYARGVARLWSASGVGTGVRAWEAISFVGGCLAVAVALVSPLHALGGVLFSAHMTQHELLMSIAAPLLVLGRPVIPWLWALSPSARRTLGDWSKHASWRRPWSFLSRPTVAFILYGIALWTWHLPGLYQSTLTSEFMHSLQHASFLVTGLLFWWTLLGARGGDLGRGSAIFFLFSTALHTSALGALLTFAPTLWYPAYAFTTTAWGLTPLEDQQLGGVIMWIPGGLPYMIAALAMVVKWLRESDRSAMHREKALVAARTTAAMLIIFLSSGCDRASGDQQHLLPNADADRGRVAIRKYGCGSCHTIPGVVSAGGLVGPPLKGIASRVYIAGVLPNQPDNMIAWIENAPAIDPHTAMPNMGVTPRAARDIAAYLYTLR